MTLLSSCFRSRSNKFSLFMTLRTRCHRMSAAILASTIPSPWPVRACLSPRRNSLTSYIGGALLIVVNLRQHNDALYGSMEKIECSLNARIPKEKRDATKALMDFQNQLSASFGQAIELDIDWAFTTSASFLSKSLGEYSRIIQSIWKTALPRIVLGNES